MLNENHALIFDFPQHKKDIVALNHKDPAFKQESHRYHQLDYDIRQLEISGVPIDDESMNQMKIERAHMKDHLYSLLKHHQEVSST